MAPGDGERARGSRGSDGSERARLPQPAVARRVAWPIRRRSRGNVLRNLPDGARQQLRGAKGGVGAGRAAERRLLPRRGSGVLAAVLVARRRSRRSSRSSRALSVSERSPLTLAPGLRVRIESAEDREAAERGGKAGPPAV